MGLMGAARRFDVPEVDAFTAPYWRAAAEGRLLLRRCRASGCGATHHYPREFCPRCWSEDVEWVAASGDATLYTWSVVHRNDLPPFGERVPYVAAVVELAEGPRMMTEVTDCPEDALRIGMPLRVTFRTEGHSEEGEPDAPRAARAARTASAEAFAVPVFRPVRRHAGPA
ncbi:MULTISPECIES: Zn-ribbon domain-containing OB-fold protein [unclassified Streptomyces]|uniref:Zn-ribbon domain-containing OB-fold protein n=1 Tax=unclassified Streptomyces TaxID=2593676 RepID=UPI002DD93C35|nr:Zn-ribbon domain-containing OB-fold protein [Streptomyces sp. NBC_01775]WSB78485.1 Zn-ribbon domain-containing OB-fold protein [Streptomyces sp. NBC_01775]WSS42102.1 Zn-ribbon domain-containing OB-fold protein [Streptomyces sp. NBC_01187]